MKSPWTEGLPDKLYVVQAEATKHAILGPNSYTVSPNPEVPGWETDGGEEGYGLSLEMAEEIARRYNLEAEKVEMSKGTAIGRAIQALESAGGGPIRASEVVRLMLEQGWKTYSLFKLETVHTALRREAARDGARVVRTVDGWRLRQPPTDTDLGSHISPPTGTPEGGKSKDPGIEPG